MLEEKRLLARWTGWFFFVSLLLTLSVQFSYLGLVPNLHNIAGVTQGGIIFAWVFLLVSYIAHTAIINFILAGIVLLLIYLFSNKWLTFVLSVLSSSILLITLIIDRITYVIYHSHELQIGMTVIDAGALNEVMPLSNIELMLLVVLIIVMLAIGVVIAWGVWRFVNKTQKTSVGRSIAWLLMVCVIFSYTTMAFVATVPQKYRMNTVQSHLMLKMARFVPYYQDLYSLLVPGSDYAIRRVNVASDVLPIQTLQQNKQLHYPLHPMQCVAPKKLPNIVFLFIDTWRYDAMNKMVTPNIAKFSKKAIQFQNQWSGGNCTQPGIFSLFYGIPSNYWTAMLKQRRGPILIDRLQKVGYQMGIYGSATENFPEFEKTVFVNVKNVQQHTRGATTVERDRRITDEFKTFVEKRDKTKPFFSYLFYDAVHNYCEGSSSQHQGPFKPAIQACKRFSLSQSTPRQPYLNRYHNAAHFDDKLAGEVLDELKRQHLLDNTIVVITSDHGEQFNDEGLGYWSHASAYTSYQLHVPMLVYWPSKLPRIVNYETTHMDLVPTLLSNVLGCRNDASDYSVGKNLFSRGGRGDLIPGSYSNYAVVTSDRVYRVYPGGDYTINNRKGYHVKHGKLDVAVMRRAYRQLQKYFR